MSAQVSTMLERALGEHDNTSWLLVVEGIGAVRFLARKMNSDTTARQSLQLLLRQLMPPSVFPLFERLLKRVVRLPASQAKVAALTARRDAEWMAHTTSTAARAVTGSTAAGHKRKRLLGTAATTQFSLEAVVASALRHLTALENLAALGVAVPTQVQVQVQAVATRLQEQQAALRRE